jgi:Domain of unknown function (DUF4382)
MQLLSSRGFLVATALGLVACGGDSQPAAAAGASRVLLTDGPFPFDRIARVDLYVVSLSASLNSDTSATAGGDFVTLVAPHRLINVLALQNGITDELGTVTLPHGAITAVRLIIATDSSSITLKDGRVLTGTSNPGIHWQSSAGRPVLNALITEQIVVRDTGAVIVVDYDVGQAFIRPQDVDPASTDSGFIFSPVLRATDATRSGSIAGTVRAHNVTGTPVVDASLRLYLGDPGMPENTWSTLATAKTDANGAFRFAYVTRSSYWAGTAMADRSYIVAVDPPTSSSLGRTLVPGVQVTTGAETAIGTTVLP